MKTYFVFDVESGGLFGDGFAFGYCVVTEEGKEIEAGWMGSTVSSLNSIVKSDQDWLEKNLPNEVLFSRRPLSMTRPQLLKMLKMMMERAKQNGWLVVTDCGYPVETGMLREAEAEVYPLFDVSTALLMAGKDPIGTFERLPNELPKHHPLADARQSARIWLECVHPKE